MKDSGKLAAPPPLDPVRDALLLDFDGTFVDFAPRPDGVRVRPGGLELLTRVSERLGGAFAIVSGRRVGDIDSFLAPLSLPVVGVHGQEKRVAPGGDIALRPHSADLGIARQRLRQALAGEPKLLLEDKNSALVLHFRQHPQMQDRAAALANEAIAGLDAVQAVPGHMIVEIRETGISKADAVRALAADPPFRGRLPVFVGDDTTDEDGFREAAAQGGFGIKVGQGETAARYRLADVDAVHAWLKGME